MYPAQLPKDGCPFAAGVRLTFMLPASILRQAAFRGPFVTVDGCRLEVNRAGLVAIEGPSRELVQDHACRYLRVVARHIIKGYSPPVTIAAIIRTRAPQRDSWEIIVGADVAFAATAIVVLPHDQAPR